MSNVPISVYPSTYIYGLLPSVIYNDSFDTTNLFSISAGQCRDSNNVMDIVVGVPNVQNSTTPDSLFIDVAFKGINGLDQGSFGASKLYAIYVIADSSYNNVTASLFSLADNEFPLMPAGYDSYRLIGYFRTDGSKKVMRSLVIGDANERQMVYLDVVNPLSSGSSSTVAAVSLDNAVPPIDNVMVGLNAGYTPDSTALSSMTLGSSLTGVNTVLNAVAGTVTQSAQTRLVCPLVDGVPTVYYQVFASDVLSLYVERFYFTV